MFHLFLFRFLTKMMAKSEKRVGSFCPKIGKNRKKGSVLFVRIFMHYAGFSQCFGKKESVLFVRFSFFLGFIWVMLFKIVIFVALKQ